MKPKLSPRALKLCSNLEVFLPKRRKESKSTEEVKSIRNKNFWVAFFVAEIRHDAVIEALKLGTKITRVILERLLAIFGIYRMQSPLVRKVIL